jgi:hypothetical protein
MNARTGATIACLAYISESETPSCLLMTVCTCIPIQVQLSCSAANLECDQLFGARGEKRKEAVVLFKDWTRRKEPVKTRRAGRQAGGLHATMLLLQVKSTFNLECP